MGYDLKNANEQFRFSVTAWQCVLDLAAEFGWQAMGTVLSEGTAKLYLTDEGASEEKAIQETIRKWDGNYVGNNLQSVIDKDALNLANALENALKVIPDKRKPEHNTLASLKDDGSIEHFFLERFIIGRRRSPDSPVDYFSGIENKNYLREFIKFCRSGSFCIH